MNRLENAASPRWEVSVGGSTHEVELAEWGVIKGAPRRFRADGVEHRIAFSLRGERTVNFLVGRHEATLTMRYISPRPWTSFKRMAGGSLRDLPAMILAALVSGSYVAGGASAAAGTSRMLFWVIYTLCVGGVEGGSYVARVEGGQLSSWTFVEPGGPLPDRTST